MALLEQPLLILFFGTLLVAGMAFVWLQTRHRWASIGVVLAVLAVSAALAIERWIVTPGEQVTSALQTIVRRLEANDVDGVLAWIAPQSPVLRQEIQTRMRQIRVKKISIKPNLKVNLGRQRPVVSAEARFNVVATLEGPRDFGGTFTVPRYVIVRFRREADGWRVKDYESFDPRGPQAGGNTGL